MKSVITYECGIEGLKIEERPEPKALGPLDVLVEVHAVSLNYRDLMVAKGIYGSKFGSPFVVGSDFAGVIIQVGSDVQELKVGERVLNSPFKFWPAGRLDSCGAKTFVGGNGVEGVMSEKVIYPAAALVKIPEHLNFIEASTLTIAGLTAWSALVTHGKILPGQWALLHGTGGVSIFAAQIAQKLGVHTILTTSSKEKAQIMMKKYGLKAALDYREEDWPQQAKNIAENTGVHVVIEVAGGKSLAGSMAACRRYGHISMVGLLGGAMAEINVVDILRHQITICGIYMESTFELKAFVKAMETWKIHPHVDQVFSIDQVQNAYKHLESQKHMGKIVIALR